MRPILLLSALLLSVVALAQSTTVSSDKNWTAQMAVLKNAMEADLIIRVGDVDNLGFGWPDGFDPFCGRMTEAHAFPWEAKPDDAPGFDRILLSSKHNPAKAWPCGADGYAASFDKQKSKPVAWTIGTGDARGVTVQNVWLQIFIDDFQSPTFCSKYQILLNGKRFVEGEKILNAIDQTGPVGKLVSLPLPEDFYAAIAAGAPLTVALDETTGAPDGFAVDFIRLLVNRKRENSCKGTVRGRVLEKGNDKPVTGARVFTADNSSVTTDGEGRFELRDLPTGFEVLGATAVGYVDGSGTADIGQGEDNPEITIYLTPGKGARFNNQTVNVGESVTLNNILFDQGKAEIKAESKPELDKLVAFLQTNATAEIELSGHTSSEGERGYNKSLSYRRVKACKDYITAKGIAEDRILAVGFGPDRPVASNDSEAGRTKNRRVEMRLKRL